MEKPLRNKKILITSGPTWVPIDKIRVITNIFKGTLGVVIAKTAHKMGAVVTLLIGPGSVKLPSPAKNFKLIKFKYFDEILRLVKKEVSSKKYDVIIHSAAVADYYPTFVSEGKIKSGKDSLVIKLKPTIKIVDLIKKLDPSIFLVKFKLEVDIPEKKLISIAYKSMLDSNADLMVANDFKETSGDHKAFIIDKKKDIIVCRGKDDIAKKLLFKINKTI